MTSQESLISDAFKTFMTQAPEQAKAFASMVGRLDAAAAMDKKTRALAYLAVLAAAGRTSGVPFHVAHAKSLGATRQQVIDAVLLGLPAVGNIVVQSLPAALEACDRQ